MKVLLVEDDTSLREGMSDILTELAEVRSVGLVDTALAALREERFELVLTDLRISGSGKGGRSIVEMARRQLQPVAIVSASPEGELQQALKPWEPDAMLIKPFQLEDMTGLVERFLALRTELERLAQERPPEAGWTEQAPGVHVLRPPRVAPEQALTWIRLQPGASYDWTHHQGRAGVLVVEGGLEVDGAQLQASHYLFLSTSPLPTTRTEKGCLAVSLAMKG